MLDTHGMPRRCGHVQNSLAGVAVLSSKRCGLRRYAEGFSLVELLVVLAVVATLIGLLAPALASARAAARSAACLSAQRQLGLVLHMYADDGGGAMPRSTHSGNAFAMRRKGVVPWPYAFFSYYRGAVFDPAEHGGASWFGAYIDAALRCADDPRGPELAAAGYGRRAGYDGSYGLYVYYELAADETGSRTWHDRDAVPLPALTVLFGESRGAETGSRAGHPTPDHFMAHFWPIAGGAGSDLDGSRHPGGTATLFLDGHATVSPVEDTFVSGPDGRALRDHWNPEGPR